MVDLDAIRKRCEAGPNPVRYYADGEPYVKIDGCELRNHPIVDALARLDRLEKHIYPALLDDVGRLRAELGAAGAAIERAAPKTIKPYRKIPGLGKCPVCKIDLCMDDDDLHYCPKCGQHLIVPEQEV